MHQTLFVNRHKSKKVAEEEVEHLFPFISKSFAFENFPFLGVRGHLTTVWRSACGQAADMAALMRILPVVLRLILTRCFFLSLSF